MADADDEHEEVLVPKLVEDPVVAHSKSPDPFRSCTGQEFRTRRTRVLRKLMQRPSDPLRHPFGSVVQLTLRAGNEANRVPRHASRAPLPGVQIGFDFLE